MQNPPLPPDANSPGEPRAGDPSRPSGIPNPRPGASLDARSRAAVEAALSTRQSGPSKGWKIVGQVKGVFLVLTVVAMALVALFVDFVLEPTLREQRVVLSPVAEAFFKAPWLVAVLSIPAVATVMPLFLGTRRVFLWITVSSILLLIPFGFFLLATVGSIAKIYSDALNF